MTATTDTARLPLLLTTLRLPTIARLWPEIGQTADTEGWPAARTLATLLEHEVAERANRRIQRHLLEARLPPGKTLDTFDFAAAPTIGRARIAALAQGDSWLATSTNILAFGPPGVGKVMLAFAMMAAIGYQANQATPPKRMRMILRRWSVQEVRRIAVRLAQRRIQPTHIIAWSLWRRAHQAAAR